MGCRGKGKLPNKINLLWPLEKQSRPKNRQTPRYNEIKSKQIGQIVLMNLCSPSQKSNSPRAHEMEWIRVTKIICKNLSQPQTCKHLRQLFPTKISEKNLPPNWSSKIKRMQSMMFTSSTLRWKSRCKKTIATERENRTNKTYQLSPLRLKRLERVEMRTYKLMMMKLNTITNLDLTLVQLKDKWENKVSDLRFIRDSNNIRSSIRQRQIWPKELVWSPQNYSKIPKIRFNKGHVILHKKVLAIL